MVKKVWAQNIDCSDKYYRMKCSPFAYDYIMRGASTFNRSFLSAKSKPVGTPVFMITSDEKRWGASFTTDRPVKPPLQRISSLYVSNKPSDKFLNSVKNLTNLDRREWFLWAADGRVISSAPCSAARACNGRDPCTCQTFQNLGTKWDWYLCLVFVWNRCNLLADARLCSFPWPMKSGTTTLYPAATRGGTIFL